MRSNLKGDGLSVQLSTFLGTTNLSSTRFWTVTMEVFWDRRYIGKIVAPFYIASRTFEYQIYDSSDRLIMTVDTSAMDHRFHTASDVIKQGGRGTYEFPIMKGGDQCGTITAQRILPDGFEHALNNFAEGVANVRLSICHFTIKTKKKLLPDDSDEQRLSIAAAMLLKRYEDAFSFKDKINLNLEPTRRNQQYARRPGYVPRHEVN